MPVRRDEPGTHCFPKATNGYLLGCGTAPQGPAPGATLAGRASQAAATPVGPSAAAAPVPRPPAEMTVKELKAALGARGVPLAGLVEKGDLVEALCAQLQRV